ncbi:MAG: isocitrate/isopropylmalate family dehydrogenase, partial [Bacteroidota bacterium]
MHQVVLIPGDGIGPSICAVAVRVIEASGVKIEWIPVEAGMSAIDKYKDPLPQHVLDAVSSTRVALKGPLTTPVGSGFRSVNVALRKEFDLYSNLRPARSFEGVQSRFKDIDIIIVRENTEEFYAGIEHYIDPQRSAAETIGVVTRSGSDRIIRYAYEYARAHGRKRVTTVHKANILKYTGGLFLEVSRKVGAEYPDIVTDDKIID